MLQILFEPPENNSSVLYKKYFMFQEPLECVPLIISDHLYFLRVSEVWSMFHHQSVGRFQSKRCYCMFTYTFW